MAGPRPLAKVENHLFQRSMYPLELTSACISDLYLGLYLGPVFGHDSVNFPGVDIVGNVRRAIKCREVSDNDLEGIASELYILPNISDHGQRIW